MRMSETEEEQQDSAHGRPNSWWAQQRTGFGAEFTAVKQTPKGGAASVTEAIGSYDLCWCGEPADHPWPGKDKGRKHPKGKTVSAQQSEEETPRIQRRDLKAFTHEDMVDIIVRAVNDYGLRYRILNQSCTLYPKDNSAPRVFHARSTDRSVKGARIWFAKHVVVDPAKAVVKDAEVLVDDMDLREKARMLAEKMNGPEHKIPEVTPDEFVKMADEQTRAAPAPQKRPVPAPQPPPVPEVQPVAPEPAEPDGVNDGWVPWVNQQGKVNENFETKGGLLRCRECQWTTENSRATSGHWLTNHGEARDVLWGPKAQERKKATHEIRRLRQQMERAIAVLGGGNDKEVLTLRTQMGNLQNQVEKLTAARDKAITERDDAIAKLALVKEAMKL